MAGLILVPPGAGATGLPPGAVAEAAHDGEEPRVEVSLLLETEVARAGRPFRAGALFRLDPGWHIYWRNPGQAGLPTELNWDIPGARVGPIQWPQPRVFRESDGTLTTYGYDGEVLLAQEITLAGDASDPVDLRLAVDFLICRVLCIPGRVELSRSLELGPEQRLAEEAAVFDRYAALVPVSAEQLGIELDVLYSQSAIRPGDSFRLALGVAFCTEGDGDCSRDFTPTRPAVEAFVPDMPASLELAVTGRREHPHFPNGFLLTAEARAAEDLPASEKRLRGVLGLDSPQGPRAVRVDVALPRAPADAEVTELTPVWLATGTSPPSTGLGSVLALALLGGLILNLMPCVLPVLAIKLFGIAETVQAGSGALRRSGLAYAAGILTSMLALGTAVIGLRAAGNAVGWGFQFQEPLFIAGIGAVLLVFALNLFGVFEISLGTSRLGAVGSRSSGDSRRSFFEGLLAVVLATPCTAPFLGTAVGFALAGSAGVILATFTAIGAGLALPYLAVCFVPAWARWVPRPGTWMLRVRALLGFALMGTLVWLLWLTGRVSGVDGLAALLAFLLALALASWIFGLLQAEGQTILARTFALVALLVAVLGAPALPLQPPPADGRAGSAVSNPWREFEIGAVRAALEGGRPVFVDFTADWCLTCQANERLVIDTAPVREAIERFDVALFRADWTRRDESIRRALASHGRAGVPLYLVYSPNRPGDPEVLPELLSPSILIEALSAAASAPRAMDRRQVPLAGTPPRPEAFRDDPWPAG
ncbi:MAG: thioredoxin family protein [Proteobacteria bacterium]|nr:thioredoxin family protein [Pseudomonadota bacterium]